MQEVITVVQILNNHTAILLTLINFRKGDEQVIHLGLASIINLFIFFVCQLQYSGKFC